MMTRKRMCKKNLKMFKDQGQQIISQILTGDETWVYYYDCPSNREAKVWIFEDEKPPKMPKQELHEKKIMYAVFFRSTGLVKYVKLVPKQRVNATWYKDVCLPQVFEVVTNQRPKTGIKGLILHHDNARPHTAAITQEYLEEMGVKTMPHPPLFS
jgi:histone-lysine N-methyltransferase SETMAR